MNTIQVDMFEVQLGAAILLQFVIGDETVRVLADAGVEGKLAKKGYPATHVRDKLKKLLGDHPRLDLIIGTHYDEDHLNGLVPIIDDPKIEIGEAWMPPIANDTQKFAVDQPLATSDLLTQQLADDQGSKVLAAYLRAKKSDIEAVGTLERELAPDEIKTTRRFLSKNNEFDNLDEPIDINFFRAQLDDADADQRAIDHGSDQEVEANPLVSRIVSDFRSELHPYRYSRAPLSLDFMKSVAVEARAADDLLQPRSSTLANLVKSAAKDAINATSLHRVLTSLRTRNIPVRSEIIEDGIPRRYRWTPGSRRFVLSRPDSKGLTFDLLGPSKSLVKKHRDRLPILEASAVAFAFRGEIRSITPSNQLSYVGCFKYDGQSVLISGDAGCVDFAEKQGVYYPKLLAALTPLHVIQIAHHGGNNAHFYRVLSAASYAEQTEKSYLLLSHATHDKTRPSPVFHDFLLSTLLDGEDVRLLFTSEPDRAKVVDYLNAINPVVGRAGKVGDIQLCYNDGWKVTAHAIKV